MDVYSNIFQDIILTKRPAPFHWEKCSLGSNLNHWYKEIYLVNYIFIRLSSTLILRKNNVKEYYNCLPLFFWSQTLFSIAFGGTKSIRRKMPNWPTSTTLSESENSLSSSVPVESVLSPSHSFRSPLWMLTASYMIIKVGWSVFPEILTELLSKRDISFNIFVGNADDIAGREIFSGGINHIIHAYVYNQKSYYIFPAL